MRSARTTYCWGPLGSDGMWTKRGPIRASPCCQLDGSSAEGRLLAVRPFVPANGQGTRAAPGRGLMPV